MTNETKDSLRAERDAARAVLENTKLWLAAAEKDQAESDREMCQLQDALGCPCEMENAHEKAMERLRDLIAAEGELGDLRAELAAMTAERDYHREAFLADWIENEALLEAAGINFTPDDSGGKPVSTAIQELIAERDKLRAELETVTAERDTLKLEAEKAIAEVRP